MKHHGSILQQLYNKIQYDTYLNQLIYTKQMEAHYLVVLIKQLLVKLIQNVWTTSKRKQKL